MAYENSQQTLADIIGGPMVAAQQGQSDAVQQALEQQKLQQQAIATRIAQATQEDQIQKSALANQFLQAQIPGEAARSQMAQTSADTAAATQAGTIGATNSANLTKMTSDQASRLANAGQLFQQVGSMLDSIPPVARPAALNQIASKYGIDMSQFPQMQQVPPEQIPAVLNAMGQKIMQASTGWQQNQVELQNKKDIAAGNNATELMRTKMTTDAAIQKQQMVNEQKQTLMNLNQLEAKLSAKQAAGQLSPDEANTLTQLRQQQAIIRQNLTNAGVLTGQLGGIPTGTPEATPGSVVQGNQAPPAAIPTAPAAIPQLAESAFGAFEPNKYDYRINPATGKLQRAPKK